MKIVMLSKALVSGAYQKKLEELARIPDISLVAYVPPLWKEPLIGTIRLERQFTHGYRLDVLPIYANGYHHVYWFAGVQRMLAREQPDVLHIDEESFNLATYLALRVAKAAGVRCCFFNWANIDRFYPPPFCFFEQYAFRHASYAIAGNHEAATLIQRHGYQGRLAVLPQFGVDPDLFAPASPAPTSRKTNGVTAPKPFIVGYLGRLIAWKGVLDLVDVMATLPPHMHLWLVGDGDLRPELEARIHALGLQERVIIRPAVKSVDVPSVLHQLDALVLPSQTQPNWKEQFGRVLIEAMSCGIPVAGSSSGEIPNVIGDAGLVFAERDKQALRLALERLMLDEPLRRQLIIRGREHVLQNYTQAALAQKYANVYREMMNDD
jgi:glycosyltransferase involved in cell wall biosynthesis